MNTRPLPVLIIGWLFIIAGIFGVVYHATEFKPQNPFEYELLLALFIRLLAIVGGVFALCGANWARLLLVVWITYHVILSGFHSLSELVIHSVLLVVVAYFLFRPKATAYFRASKSTSTETTTKEDTPRSNGRPISQRLSATQQENRICLPVQSFQMTRTYKKVS